jgi:hypothetical protein
MPKELVLTSLLSGLIGAVFGPMCFLAYGICGGIAVGFYLETDIDIYMSDRDARRSGILSGISSGILSMLLIGIAASLLGSWLQSFGRHLPVGGLKELLLAYEGSFWALAIGNMAVAVIGGLLGGWGALRWVFPNRRIPVELQ